MQISITASKNLLVAQHWTAHLKWHVKFSRCFPKRNSHHFPRKYYVRRELGLASGSCDGYKGGQKNPSKNPPTHLWNNVFFAGTQTLRTINILYRDRAIRHTIRYFQAINKYRMYFLLWKNMVFENRFVSKHYTAACITWICFMRWHSRQDLTYSAVSKLTWVQHLIQ
jgi:hypothetical protein